MLLLHSYCLIILHVCVAIVILLLGKKLGSGHFIVFIKYFRYYPLFQTSSAPVKGKAPTKSKIPVISPTSGGVNVEDFRLCIIRGSVASAAKCIKEGRFI